MILACDDVPAEPFVATGAAAGIDMGVAALVTTSDGAHVADPRHLATTADRLAHAHKAESAGRQLTTVNPADTSRTCSRCGRCAADNRLTQAAFALCKPQTKGRRRTIRRRPSAVLRRVSRVARC